MNESLEMSKGLYSKCVEKFAIKIGPNEVQIMGLKESK